MIYTLIVMKYIKTGWDIPYYNFALEEYMLECDKFNGGCFFFYIHRPSIIIGSHQNAFSEINSDYVKEKGIIVARRLTGGGAVYHDGGNLNFSYIFDRGENDFIDFARYTQPVMAALKSFGVECSLSGRNDITARGRKFSGNAEMRTKNKLLHHGTLMFDVDVREMVSSLDPDNMKFIDKAVDSVKSRVINIKDLICGEGTIEDLKDAIISETCSRWDVEEYELTAQDLAVIEDKVKNRFSTYEHNFGSSPKFSCERKNKYPAGLIRLGFEVQNGLIADILISGDFFLNGELEDVYEALKGVRYEKDDVQKALSMMNSGRGFDNIINNFTAEEFLGLMFS